LLATDKRTTYLDYLRASEAEFDVPEQEYPRFLAAHRDFVRTGLIAYAANDRVLKKYRWLQEYHDRSLIPLERMYGRGSARPEDLRWKQANLPSLNPGSPIGIRISDAVMFRRETLKDGKLFLR